MKTKLIFRTLAISVILALLIMAIPGTPALASVTVSPTSGPAGTIITISGSGFTDGETYTITFAYNTVYSQLIGSGTIGGGAITSITYTVPTSIPGGSYRIRVAASGGLAHIATFTLTPKITLDKSSGVAGDEVIIDGTSFAANSAITLYFGTEEVGTTTTDSTGEFTDAAFIVPASYQGSHSIKALDGAGNSATASFSTRQAITVSPTTGASGDTVTVTGDGFKARKAITVTFDIHAVTTSPLTITTDDYGSFTGTFPIPVIINGTYQVNATDGTNKSSANFVVLAGAEISPAAGNVGTKVTVKGTGFTVGVQVPVTYDGEKMAEVIVDNNGSFTATFEVPASEHGTHNVILTDPINTANSKQFTFTMESEAPPTPAPLVPEQEIKAEAQAFFDWEDVEDPSGVTYTLQVATKEDQTDEGFSTAMLVFEKKGLTESEYTLTEEEKLESVKKEEPYYWSVRAVDGASNNSGWSTPGPFYVGFQWPELKGALLYVLIGIGFIVVLFLGFWLGRRTSYY